MPTNTRTNASQDTAGTVPSRSRYRVETAVDLPVGAALSVKDRVEELAKPWRNIDTATDEVKSLRHRFDRELNKVERRGGTARRKATQRAKRTRNRVERQVSQRRRRAESTLRTNRRRAEQRFREARARVGERVPSL
jgi:F0F1-type ATP synthase membrane subunit b/b'